MTTKSLTLKDAREKAQTLQDNLGKVFAEAKTDDGQYDYNKVTYFGAEVKGSIPVAEKVKAMTDELDEVMGPVETLHAADNAAKAHCERAQARRHSPLPGGGERRDGGHGRNQSAVERRTHTQDTPERDQKGKNGER